MLSKSSTFRFEQTLINKFIADSILFDIFKKKKKNHHTLFYMLINYEFDFIIVLNDFNDPKKFWYATEILIEFLLNYKAANGGC